MGLDVSHDAWRTALARAAGGDLVGGGALAPRAHYTYETAAFETPEQEAGFRELMSHSDGDGEISPEMCAHVADALEHLLPRIPDTDELGGGHIARAGGMRAATERFIAGCRGAHEAGDTLEFG